MATPSMATTSASTMATSTTEDIESISTLEACTETTCLLAKPSSTTATGVSFANCPPTGTASSQCSSAHCYSDPASEKRPTENNDRNENSNNNNNNNGYSRMLYGPGAASGGWLNYSSNALLVYRLQDMRSSSNTNLVLALLCLVYLGINVTLICVNYVNSQFASKHPPSEEDLEPVDDTAFHLVEFWATFGFALVECVALAVTPKSHYAISSNPLFLRVVLFLNIVATSVPAVMISFSLETFEILSHEIEYINELTMSFIDVILLLSLWKSKASQTNNSNSGGSSSNNRNRNKNNDIVPQNQRDDAGASSYSTACLTTFVALAVAIVQLGVYNGMGYDEERQDLVGEVPGHFLEFSFEIISSLIAFWFCMDNKAVADKEIGLIMYGNVANHNEDCQICEGQVTEFALDHQVPTTLQQQQQQQFSHYYANQTNKQQPSPPTSLYAPSSSPQTQPLLYY